MKVEFIERQEEVLSLMSPSKFMIDSDKKKPDGIAN
jgi:hypothetical protein